MTIYLEVDKSFAKLYDEVSYTVRIKNEGQKIDSLRIVSPFNEEMAFKWIQMNDTFYNDKSIIMEGLLLKDLEKWEEVKVIFVGVLMAFPKENPITHIVDVYYNIGKEAYVLTSNAVITYIIDANITYEAGTLLLEADQVTANKGDLITYKLWMVNQGNRKAEQILIGTLAPFGTYLLPETVTCLESKVTLTPEAYLYIESLEIGERLTCFYTVKVEEDVSEKTIPQTLHIVYRLAYPNRQSEVQRVLTNCVDIPIETVYFQTRQGSLKQEISQSLATEGDVLTYTLKGYNVGTVEASCIEVVDYIPEGTRWIEESLVINEQKAMSIQQAFCIKEGAGIKGKRLEVMLSDCQPGEGFSIAYQVEVLGRFPVQPLVKTSPQLTYAYSTGQRVIKEKVEVEVEAISVVWACIDPIEKHLLEGFEKVMTLGEEIKATLSFINKGNVEAEALQVVLDLPQGLVLTERGWIEEEGKYYKNYEASLKPGATYIETLGFQVVALPTVLEPIIGIEVLYTYNIGEERIEQISAQEEIPIDIEAACIARTVDESQKYFAPQEVCVGEEVYCTLTLTNTGNVALYHLIVQEELIEGLQLLEHEDGRLHLEKLEPKETKYLTYKAQVVGLPASGKFVPVSHIGYSYTTSDNKSYIKQVSFRGEGLQVSDAYMSPFTYEQGVQFVEKEVYTKGDMIQYTLPIANLGNVVAHNITLFLPQLEVGKWQNNQPIVIDQLMPQENLVLHYNLELTQVPVSGQLQVAPILYYDFEMKKTKRKIERSYSLDPVEVHIQYAALEEDEGLIRSVDTQITPLHEVVYYTIHLQNTGNVPALEVRIQEEALGGCIYEKGSLTINGVAIEHNLFEESVLVGDIDPGQSYYLRYGVKVSQVPVEGYFYTRSVVTYDYNVGSCMRNQKVTTKPIGVGVEDAALEMIIGTDGYNVTEQSVDLGEAFGFDVMIQAKGNVQADDLYYSIEGEGICFEPDLNRMPIHIPVLASGETKVISVVGKVNEFVLDGKLNLKGKLCYEFGTGVYRRQHTLYTQVQHLYIYGVGPLTQDAFSLDMSKKVVHLGESVTLTFKVLGEGNCPMEEAILSLQGFEGVGFQVNKVYIDEELVKCKSIEEGLELGTLYPGQMSKVVMEGVMTSIPEEAVCEYEGCLTYRYLSATYKRRKKASHSTGKHIFVLKESGLSQQGSITLKGDKKALRKGESMLYTLRLVNEGNVKTEKIKLHLMIDDRLVCDPLAYTITGSVCKGEPLNELWIEHLKVGEWVEIQFQAVLKTLVSKEDVKVTGTVMYEYEDGEEILKVCERDIPAYLVCIESADFEGDYLSLSVDKEEVAMGEVVHCQVYCENGGNKKAEQVKLQLQWPNTFKYVPPTFLHKDKVDKTGQIHIGTLEPMEKRLITFDLIADHLTKQEEQSDLSVVLTYKDKGESVQLEPILTPLYCIGPLLEITSKLDSQRVIVEEQVICTLQIMNKGNRKVEKGMLVGLLPQEMGYVLGSLKIDGSVIEDVNLEEDYKGVGLQVGSIEAGQVVTLTYKGRMKHMPQEAIVQYSLQFKYSYILNKQVEEAIATSETIVLAVESPNLCLQKLCNKQKINVGEEVEISVKLVNIGSIHLDQIIFYDQMQEGILFVEGSFKRDGKRQGVVDLTQGVGLGPLKKQRELFITYKLRIQNYTGSKWVHQVYAEYLFNKADLKISKKKSEVLVDTLQVTSPYNVSLIYETQIFLSYGAPDLYEILSVDVTVDVLEAYRLVNNPKEAEIKGVLNYSITYRSVEENRQIQVKKVWGQCIQLVSQSTLQPLKIEVETQNVAYAIVHKRALKVEVGLLVSEV